MILDKAIIQIKTPVQNTLAPARIAKNEAPSVTVIFSNEFANVLFERKTNEEWLKDASIFPGTAPGCDAFEVAATMLCTSTVNTIANMPQKATE